MDKFRLFYEEIEKINLSENPVSQMIQSKTTQDKLILTTNILHQLASATFLGPNFNIESLILVLKKILDVQNLATSEITQTMTADFFVKSFSSFFQHIEHLSHILRFAPPDVKKLQLALLTEVLLKQNHEHHEAQITHLSNHRIKTIIQQSLQFSSEEFHYQTLIHRCMFELLQRSIDTEITDKGMDAYQNWLAKFSLKVDKCLKNANLNHQSILDGLEQFEHFGKSFKDLFAEAENKLMVSLSFNQTLTPKLLSTLQIKRKLLEKLRFGQERRYDYLQKICRNIVNDYLSVSKDLKEKYLSDNHLSDETFVNLSRKIDIKSFLEIIQQQNTQTFSAPLFIGELMGIKLFNVGKLKANLALKNYPFPNPDKKNIQEFIVKTTQEFNEKRTQLQELKNHLEKAQVIAYTIEGERTPEIKFAVRLNYASAMLLNFCLNHNRFPSDDEIAKNSNLNLQCLTIRDSKNLDEAVIQNAIRTREALRIKEINQQRVKLQEQIESQKKAQQLQQEVKYRLAPLENHIQQLKAQKKQLEDLIEKKQAQLCLEKKSKALADNTYALTIQYFSMKAQQELSDSLLQSLDKKLQYLTNSEKQQKQLGGLYLPTTEINYLQLKRKQEQIQLNQLQQSIAKLEPFINPTQILLSSNEAILKENIEQLIEKQLNLKSEISHLEAFIDCLCVTDIEEPQAKLKLIEHELEEKISLHQQIISILPNACYQEFQQLVEMELQFKTLSELLIDKRSMFAAFKENFPAPKISQIGLKEINERCFRKLLELYSIYQEARLLLPPMILGLFEQLEHCQLHEFEFPKNMLNFEQLMDKIFKTISHIQLNHELSANLEFSIKRQQAIINEQSSNQNISIIKQNLANLLSTTSPKALEQIKQVFLDLFTNAYHIDLLTQLDIENVSANKMKHDINTMLDNLFRIAKAVREGKSFILAEEEDAYIEAILNVFSQYGREQQLNTALYLPNFESLGFKLKHSQCTQYVTFYDAKQQSVLTIPIELKKALPYSLRKFADSGYFLSYGGSRGVTYHAAHANKRLMTNNRLIGHGQYGSVFQASDFFALTELAFKQVVTSMLCQDVFDPAMQTNPSQRAIYARQDNLNQDEEIINDAFNQAIGICAPHHPIIEHVKPSLYIQDARAKKISGAQNLALGESLADLSIRQRQNLSKEMEAYHNPCLRADFDLLEQINQTLAKAHAIIQAIEKYHRLGFTHGDIKPENIMLYQKPGNYYEACLIDKATSAFQRPYLGKHWDLSIIFQQMFSNKVILLQKADRIESQDGYYVIKTNDGIFFGKKALLQITFGSRNCTLPYIAPCMIDDPKSSDATIITYDNQSMDNWATSVLLFGLCQTKTYFNLVQGRIATDYRVPGILKVIGSNPHELGLEIESLALFNKYFACEKSESVMFVPANLREGEPYHLYRFLSKMSDDLDKKTPCTTLSKTQRQIQAILDTIFNAIANGTGLTIHEIKDILIQIEQCKLAYEKIMHSQTIEEIINPEQQYDKALKIAQSSQPHALRVAIDEQHCVLDILCLNAKTPEQFAQTKKLLSFYQSDLIDMFIGPQAICHSLLQKCVAKHQQEIVLMIIDKIKQQASYSELLEKTQLHRQTAQENLTEVFLALTLAIPPSYSTPFIKWNKNCLEFAIDHHNQAILTEVLAKNSYHKQNFLEALRRCALNDNMNFFQQIFAHVNLFINEEDIVNFHLISAYHIWMSSHKNWQIIEKLNDKVLNQLLTSPENPALLACQFANLAAVLSVFKTKKEVLGHIQWQALLCNRDLENKTIFYHALENKEKTSDILELFSHIQYEFGEQQIIELLLQQPRPQHFQVDTIKALLTQTQEMPLQQMAIVLCATPWLMEQRQNAQHILEDMAYLTPQSRLETLAYLSALEDNENHFFKQILQKYLPKPGFTNFEFHCLFHPKIIGFLEDCLIKQLQSMQQQYQLNQCKQNLPEIVKQLQTEDKALFSYMEQLIHDFQLSQLPIASKISINQQTLERLSIFCQLYASPQAPNNLTQDFLDIFDTKELKRLLKLQKPKDLICLSQQFGPIIKILLKSQLSASDKLLALEQIQYLKTDLQSHLTLIQQALEKQQQEHFKSNLNQICEAISEKINNLNSRKHFKAASRLQVLYEHLSHEKNQVFDESLFNRCNSYFQKAFLDEELKTHRHWLLAWLYKLLGLNKPTKTIELLHTLHEQFENIHNQSVLNFSVH